MGKKSDNVTGTAQKRQISRFDPFSVSLTLHTSGPFILTISRATCYKQFEIRNRAR